MTEPQDDRSIPPPIHELALDEYQMAVRALELLTNGEARRIRRSRGITLRDVADEIGSDQASISRWETGKKRPQLGRRLVAYAAFLEKMEAMPEDLDLILRDFTMADPK